MGRPLYEKTEPAVQELMKKCGLQHWQDAAWAFEAYNEDIDDAERAINITKRMQDSMPEPEPTEEDEWNMAWQLKMNEKQISTRNEQIQKELYKADVRKMAFPEREPKRKSGKEEDEDET